MLCGKYTILNCDTPTELLFTKEGEQLTTLDNIVTVGCALVNVCDGIILGFLLWHVRGKCQLTANELESTGKPADYT